MINHTYVSTNDEKIKKIAENCGSRIINRPEDLSTDSATSESAIIHALDEIEKTQKIKPDIVVFLQATSPLRKKNDIDDSIVKFINDNADSMFSVTKIEDLTLWVKEDDWKSLNFNYKKRLMRQDRPANYIENGSIYIFKPELIRKCNNRIGGKISTFEMDFWQTWEIDTKYEIDLIEFFLAKNGIR